MKKKIIVSVFVSIVVIAAIIVTAVVLSRKEPASADDPSHDKTVTTPEGETIELDYSGTEDLLNGNAVDKYTDQDGNTYSFDKDGKNTAFTATLDSYRDVLYRYQNGEFESVEEERAVEIASDELSSRFPDYFPSMSLVRTRYAEDDGSWLVIYAELLGEGDFIKGISCNATIRADGSVDQAVLAGTREFEGIGDEQVEGITYERIVNDVESSFKDNFGDKLVSYEIMGVSLKIVDGRVVVAATAMPEVLQDDGSTRAEEWPPFTYELND